MADAGIDVLMKVVGAGGAYAAESHTTFVGPAVQDPLRSGFTPGQFCELQSFSFSVGAESSMTRDKDDGDDGNGQEGARGRNGPAGPQSLPAGQRFGREPVGGGRGSGILGGSGLPAAGRKRAEDDVDIKPVQYTRILDSMSTQLFSALVGSETLESLTVVKRRASGLNSSGACYLRLDFTKVLMIDLEWRDGQSVVIETGSFIYRKVKVLYRPQKADGKPDVAVQAEWEMPARK